MQFPPERSKFFDESFLDKVMDVFGVGTESIDLTGVGFCARGNLIQGPQSLQDFLGRENPARLESFGPGAVDRDLVGQEPAIECKGPLELVELSIGLAFEASSP